MCTDTSTCAQPEDCQLFEDTVLIFFAKAATELYGLSSTYIINFFLQNYPNLYFACAPCSFEGKVLAILETAQKF